jgi:hypothetical protein
MLAREVDPPVVLRVLATARRRTLAGEFSDPEFGDRP